MILREISSNQPYILIAAPLIAIISLLPALGSGGLPVLDVHIPMDNLLQPVFKNNWILVLTTTALIAAGSLYSNVVFNRAEFIQAPTFVPGILYAAIGSALCMVELSLPLLMANLFILAGLRHLLNVYREYNALGEYFMTGFWLGLAALSFPPFIALLPALIICIVYTRSFNWREHLLAILGFFVPFLYWLAFNYLTSANEFFLFKKIFSSEVFNMFSQYNLPEKALLSVVGVVVLMALPRYLFLSDRTSNKAKNVRNVFFIISLFMFLSVIPSIMFSGSWVPSSGLIPFSFIGGFWFTNYRYSLAAPFVFYITLAMVIVTWLFFYQIL